MTICEHLDPKEVGLENKWAEFWKKEEVPFHTCRLKQARGMENKACAFSACITTFILQYVRYNEIASRACPMFTSNPILAERMYNAAKGLREYITEPEPGAVVGSQ